MENRRSLMLTKQIPKYVVWLILSGLLIELATWAYTVREFS